MNYPMSIWKTGLCLLLTILAFSQPSFASEGKTTEGETTTTFEELIVMSGNPIMIIRCRQIIEEDVLKDKTNPFGQSKMMVDCPEDYELGPDGGCIPDCGGGYTFNPITSLCELNTNSNNSFCPEVLDETTGCPTTNPCPEGWFFLNGECYEEVSCFSGAILASPVFDCNNLMGDLVPVILTFTSSDPTNNPLNEGDYVRITDITNCLDVSSNEYFQQAINSVVDATSADDLTPRVGPANAAGEIVIEFFALDGTNIDVTAADTDAISLPVVCQDPIPSMGQWGLMIFALLLSSLGLVFMARRKVA